ncbi:MAG: response regulator [Verrucomicrobiota bacterium]|nr:response regulator [Verrucomicrobiota bacterium]
MNTQAVLLVDDDEVFRERLARALRVREFAVTTAADVPQALDMVRIHPPAMAVVDLRMPGGSGLELVRVLHALDPLIRIVVLTGFGSIANALEAIRMGASDYLTKPADADQVAAALRGKTVARPDVGEVPSLDQVEWEHIQRVLSETGGNISATARMLGIDRRSLQRKLSKFAPEG